MALTVAAAAHWNGPRVVTEPHRKPDQRDRIIEALGPLGECSPSVDDETLCRYYTYLSARLSLPFPAHYPEPTNSRERREFACMVLELLDPTEHLGDEFDGIFCKTRKGEYEINLPLVELGIPQNSPNFQLIEDYGYWFWNWR
jgi:hypothetical protein